MISSKLHHLAFIAVAIIIFGGAIAFALSSPPPQRHATFVRPGGGYSIVVYRFESRLPMMPGQSSDSPGEVQLLNNEGKILQKVKVEMVQLVEQVEWRESSVSIKLIADWPLP